MGNVNSILSPVQALVLDHTSGTKAPGFSFSLALYQKVVSIRGEAVITSGTLSSVKGYSSKGVEKNSEWPLRYAHCQLLSGTLVSLIPNS